MDPRRTDHMTDEQRTIWALQSALDALVRSVESYEPFDRSEKCAYAWVQQRAAEARETLTDWRV